MLLLEAVLVSAVPAVVVGGSRLPAVDFGVAARVGHGGGNAFLPVPFLIATVLSGEAVLPEAQNTDMHPAAFGMLLTPVYAAGLLFRPRRRIARMGVDSPVVLVLYLVGVVAVFAVATTQWEQGGHRAQPRQCPDR